MNGQNILKFFEFIYDRQLIWHKRFVQKLEKPWTENEVLKKFLFCNMYRELDKGTSYLTSHVINKDISLEEKILNIVGYRFFNRYDFFNIILDGELFKYKDFSFKYYEEKLDKRIAEKVGLFNNAYLITQVPVNKDYRVGNKHVQILFMLEILVNKLREGYAQKLNINPDSDFKQIVSIPLVGRFLGGQLLVDVTYIPGWKYSGNDFCVVGPGASDGIMLMEEKRLSYEEEVKYCLNLRDIQEKYWILLFGRTGKNWIDIAYKHSYCPYPWLSAMNIQHNLCEFRKYTNITNFIAGGRKCKLRYYR